MLPSFTDVFKKPDDFNFLGLNTAKYFYDHSLTRETELVDEPKLIQGFNRHDFLRNPFLVVTSLLKLLYLLVTCRNKIIFYGASNRLVKEDGSFFDIYNYNIIKDIGPKKVLIIQDRRDTIKGKIFSPNLIMDDFTPLMFLIKKIFFIFQKKELHKFNIRNGRKLKVLGFSDDECITKLLEFSPRTIFFRFFLGIIKPKSTLVICHYSKHAFIAACKQLKIPVIELMHGHILSHPYYNNPKVSPEFIKAFREWSLPDYFGVYGNFWRDTLIEGKLFPESSAVNIGYFLKTVAKKSRTQKTDRKKTILIASDGIMQTYFLNYVEFLKTKLDPEKHRVIIKLHPSEDGRIFSKVIDNKMVFLETRDIYYLFNLSDILINVYSSVLFEAVIYDIRIYSLFIPKYQKWCEDVVNTGIAEKLEMDQLPDFSPINNKRKRYFIDTYNFENIKSLLNNNI